MRWFLFLLLFLGAVWAGVVAAQRQLAGLPLAPSPSSLVADLRQAVLPRLSAPTESTKKVANWSVPVLMYHHVQNLPAEQSGTLDWGLSISTDAFAKQLEWLQKRGYHSVSMADLAAGKLPTKPIALTFDDGYADFYTTAWPILKQFDFGATLYAITNRLDQPGFLTSDQLTSLANAGVEIGSHSVSHPNLSKLSGARLDDELVQSRKRLQRLSSQAVASFCYPSGEYSDVTVAAVRAAGYQTAVTTHEGFASGGDLYVLERLRVKPSLTLPGFTELLLAQPQSK